MCGDISKQYAHILYPWFSLKMPRVSTFCVLAALNMVSSPHSPQALGLWKEESVHPQSGSLQSSCWTPLSLPGSIQRRSYSQNYGGRCGWAACLQQTGLHPPNKRRCSDKHDNRLSHSPGSWRRPESCQVSILLRHVFFVNFSQLLFKYYLQARKLMLFPIRYLHLPEKLF